MSPRFPSASAPRPFPHSVNVSPKKLPAYQGIPFHCHCTVSPPGIPHSSQSLKTVRGGGTTPVAVDGSCQWGDWPVEGGDSWSAPLHGHLNGQARGPAPTTERHALRRGRPPRRPGIPPAFLSAAMSFPTRAAGAGNPLSIHAPSSRADEPGSPESKAWSTANTLRRHWLRGSQLACSLARAQRFTNARPLG